MNAQEQIFSLMAVAEDQQKTLDTLLAALTEERQELAKERGSMALAASELRKAASETMPAFQKVAGEAVGAAMAGASEMAVEALGAASRPIVGQLSGVVKAAGEAEGKLSGAVAAFGWKWAVVAGGAAAGGIVAVLLAAWLAVWWQRHQVEQLAEQKVALLGEVAQLQASAEEWAKRGGRAKLEKCGDQGRLCVRIDKSRGYGKDGDYYVLRGY